MKETWEYSIVPLLPVYRDAVHQLNRAGLEGWELVAIMYRDAYMKRRLPQ